MYGGARWWKGAALVEPKVMDFVSGLAEIEAASYDEPPPRNWVERFWGWLVGQISSLPLWQLVFMFLISVLLDVIRRITSVKLLSQSESAVCLFVI